MANRLRPVTDADREARRLLHELCGDLREARIRAGLTQRVVAARTRGSQAQISRLEGGSYEPAGLVELARLAAALGLRLRAQLYPVGAPLRDQAQLALLSRFEARLHPSVSVDVEVPMPIAGDLRAWDLVLACAGVRIGVEAVTRLRDAQALLRSVRQKQRDSAIDRVLIVVAATAANRRALAAAGGGMAGTPLRTRTVVAALAAATDPGTDAIILL